MTRVVSELPSGLLVVTHTPDPPPEPIPPNARCRVCDAPHPVGTEFGIWRTGAGWSIHKPICRHGDWVECPACEAVPEPAKGTPERDVYYDVRNCPVCGTDGEYC
jgi:hypothetical protein